MAEKKVINLEIKSNAEETAQDTQKLAKATEKAAKETENLSKEAKKAAKELDKTTKEATKRFGKFGDSIKGAAKGIKGGLTGSIKGLGGALKGLGIITIIIAAFGKLKDMIMQNQAVADTMNTLFTTMTNVFNQVFDAIKSTYEIVNDATGGFDALGKVVGGIITLSLTPLKLAFYGIKLGVQEAQLMWEKSIFGSGDETEIKRLQQNIKDTKQDIIDVGTSALQAGKDIYDNFGEAIDEVTAVATVATEELSKVSIKAAHDQAKALTEARNANIVAQAEQTKLLETYDRQAEKLRQLRDDERNSIEVRRKANEDLLAVLDDQEQAMLKQADLQVRAAQLEYETNKTIENKAALIEAQANQLGVLAQVEGLRSEQKANDMALDKEALELINAKLAAEQELSFSEKRFNAERIEDEQERLAALLEINEQEKEADTLRLQAKIDSYTAGTQARLDAEIELNARLLELDQERINLQEQQSEESKAKYEEELDAKFNLAKSSLNGLASLMGSFAKGDEKRAKKAFEIQKKLNIATALLDTYRAAQAAFTQVTSKVGPIAGGFAAAAATAAGLARVNSIRQTEFNSPSASGGGSPAGGNLPQSNPATFNIIGGSGVNQLAESLGSAPLKAYVVAADVTDAQALDRAKIEQSSF